jgi:hypothetical protein
MGRACSSVREKRSEYEILMGKSGRRRLIGIPRHRRKDTIKIDLREVW